jgi:hypothetical protein
VYSKVVITCPIHGNFPQTPNNHLKGYGCASCASCASESRARNNHSSTSEFISKANITHNNEYTYEKSQYTRSNAKIIITCPIHGDFRQTANSHLSGIKCKQCALINKQHPDKSNLNQFIIKANVAHDNKYTYDNAVYVSTHTKLKITCPIHGDFEKTPNNHINYHKQGCPMCACELTDSKGVVCIEKFLTNNNINFEKEKSFFGCSYKKLLRFDFFIPSKNLLIEFDGSQHFSFIEYIHKTIDKFEDQVIRDNIKTKFAFNNNIELIRIKYNQINNISEILSNTFL